MKNSKKILAFVIALCSLHCYGMEQCEKFPECFTEQHHNSDQDWPIQQFSHPSLTYDLNAISSDDELDEKMNNNFLLENFEFTLEIVQELKQDLLTARRKISDLEKENKQLKKTLKHSI